MRNSRMYMTDAEEERLKEEDVTPYELDPEIHLTENSDECGKGKGFAAFYNRRIKRFGPAGVITIWSGHHHIQDEVKHFQEVFNSFDPEQVRRAVVHLYADRAAWIVYNLNILYRLERYSEKTTRELQSGAALTTALLSISLDDPDVRSRLEPHEPEPHEPEPRHEGRSKPRLPGTAKAS